MFSQRIFPAHRKKLDVVRFVGDKVVTADSLAMILNKNGFSAYAAYSAEVARIDLRLQLQKRLEVQPREPRHIAE